MTIVTDKAAYFPGEPIVISSLKKHSTVYLSPLQAGSTQLNWTPLEKTSSGEYRAPETTGMYAVGTNELGGILTETIIQVINTPVKTTRTIGICLVATLGAVTIAAIGLGYYAYRKLKKPK
jgi:hypothetical protein